MVEPGIYVKKETDADREWMRLYLEKQAAERARIVEIQKLANDAHLARIANDKAAEAAAAKALAEKNAQRLIDLKAEEIIYQQNIQKIADKEKAIRDAKAAAILAEANRKIPFTVGNKDYSMTQKNFDRGDEFLKGYSGSTQSLFSNTTFKKYPSSLQQYIVADVRGDEIRKQNFEIAAENKRIADENARKQEEFAAASLQPKSSELNITFGPKPEPTLNITFPEPERGPVGKILAGVGTSVQEERKKENLPFFTKLAIGASASALGGAEFVRTAVTQSPVQTGRDIIQGVKNIPAQIPALIAVAKTEPVYALGFLGGEVAQSVVGLKVGGQVKKVAIKSTDLLTGKIKPVVTSGFGKRTIANVPDIGDIKLIPGAADLVDPFKDIKIKKIIADAPSLNRLKPKIPSDITPIEKKILKSLTDEKVTGSLVEEVFQKTTKKRGDIDILSPDIKKTATKIKKVLGEEVQIKTQKITDSGLGQDFEILRVYKDKKLIADIDPIKFAEEGLAKKAKVKVVDDIPFIPPAVRLESKLTQLKRGKVNPKVKTDVARLTGVDLDSPQFKGAFGYPDAEIAKLKGQTGPVTSSAQDLFGVLKKKVVTKSDDDFGLFGTPFEPKTKIAQTRETFLGIGSKKQKSAGIIDVLTGKATFKKQKPQIIVFPDETIGKTFKTIRKTPGELEVTIPTGSKLKKVASKGVAYIDGKRIQIIEAAVVKSKKPIGLLDDFDIPKAKVVKPISLIDDTAKVAKKISKDTGIDFYSAVVTKPYIAPAKIISPVAIIGKSIVSKPPVRISVPKVTKPLPAIVIPPKVSVPKVSVPKVTRPLPAIVIVPKVSVPKLIKSDTSIVYPIYKESSPIVPTGSSPFVPTKTSPIVPTGTSSPPPVIPGKSYPTPTSPRPIGFSSPTPYRYTKDVPPVRPPVVRPRLSSKRPKKKLRKKIRSREKPSGYYAYGKQIKTNKYIRLNKVPVSIREAKDIGSYLTDHSLSTNYKIKPTTKKQGDSALTVPSGYHTKTRSKFRDYKISKGKKVPMKNKWIEKRGKGRLDTRSEIKKISLFAKLNSIRKKSKRRLKK